MIDRRYTIRDIRLKIDIFQGKCLYYLKYEQLDISGGVMELHDEVKSSAMFEIKTGGVEELKQLIITAIALGGIASMEEWAVFCETTPDGEALLVAFNNWKTEYRKRINAPLSPGKIHRYTLFATFMQEIVAGMSTVVRQ